MITAILILGLGIGGNTAIYSVIEAVLLKPLPYPHPEQLVQVYQSFRSFDNLPLDYPDYVDLKAGQHSFREMALSLNDDFTLTGHGTPELISGSVCFRNILPPIWAYPAAWPPDRSNRRSAGCTGRRHN